ncbi:MAG: hypothetical protein NTY60_02155 [Proteobacteria bacterium]|nr:hypothetical protein [Pseudomonadota bacterium]
MGELSVIELLSPPDDFLPNEPEGAAFHKAFLASGIINFNCRYLAIFRDEQRIAVIPYFLSTFSLGTLLPDSLLKSLLAWIKFSYVCVGHPSTDFGMIDGEVSAEVLALVNTTLGKKAALIAYKGFSEKLPLEGFTRARGLPVAVLNIEHDYYSEIDGHRRRDFKHKLEKAQSLRFETCASLSAQLALQVFELYLNTYNHAPLKFERLTLAYFQQTAAISRFLLFFEADTLIGFAQIIGKNQKALFKYVGMNYLHNRQYGLYYVMCLKGIEVCERKGYHQLELGVTSYHFKRLLGGQLVETGLYFRHSHPLINYLLGKFKFLIEPTADELM